MGGGGVVAVMVLWDDEHTPAPGRCGDARESCPASSETPERCIGNGAIGRVQVAAAAEQPRESGERGSGVSLGPSVAHRERRTARSPSENGSIARVA